MADNALYEILGVPTKATDAELKKVILYNKFSSSNSLELLF